MQYLAYHRGTWHGGRTTPERPGSVRSASRSRPRSCTPSATRWAWRSTARGCSLAYFGDGSASEGDFHEAANLAGVFTAPAILFCQNNGWAISVPTERQTAGEIFKRAEGYGFPGVRVDGNDVLAVYRTTREAAARVCRRRADPDRSLTYRIGAHSTADDPGRYRVEDEVAAARAFDPIVRFRSWLESVGHIDGGVLADWGEIEPEVLAIRNGVIAQLAPPVEWMFDHTYADPRRSPNSAPRCSVAEVTMVGALNAALRDALREDDRVLVFGEDVGRSGGVFRVTDGLQAEFGDRRIRHPDQRGGHRRGRGGARLRRVAKRRRDAVRRVLHPALEQIVDHVAKMRERAPGPHRADHDPDAGVPGDQGEGAPRREPRRSTCTRPDSRWSRRPTSATRTACCGSRSPTPTP